MMRMGEPIRLSQEGALDSKSLDTRNEDVKRLTSTIATMEGTCVTAACLYAQKTPPKKDALNVKIINMPQAVKGEADAKIATSLSEAVLDFRSVRDKGVRLKIGLG